MKLSKLWALILAIALLWASAASQTPRSRKLLSTPDCGGLNGQVLQCAKFGFTYRVPVGWVDRTQQMRPEASSDRTPSDGAPKAQSNGGLVLLAVFEHPPEVGGGIVDPGVIIAAEPAGDYPKVKSAADYFGPLGDIAAQRGLKMEDEPYAFWVGSKQLARGDFRGGSDSLPVWQSSLVTLHRDYIVSFTFVSSSDDEIDDLIDNLKFTAVVSRKAPK